MFRMLLFRDDRCFATRWIMTNDEDDAQKAIKEFAEDCDCDDYALEDYRPEHHRASVQVR